MERGPNRSTSIEGSLTSNDRNSKIPEGQRMGSRNQANFFQSQLSREKWHFCITLCFETQRHLIHAPKNKGPKHHLEELCKRWEMMGF